MSYRSVRSGESGAALMLALWALFVLSALVLTWALNIDTRLKLNGEATRQLEAAAMAASGAEIALHPNVQANSPVLRGGISGTQTYDARITGEGGRLNLNWVMAGEQPERLELLRKFLETKGVDLNERDRMIDTLLDWVDPDNLVRLNGAEIDGDYRPTNTLLTRVEDVKRVRGWEDFCARPDWDADFTVNSTGLVDILWAPRDLLLSLPGLAEQNVEQFLQLRLGPDGEEGTEDDSPFKSMEEVRVALGLSTAQFSQLEPLIILGDPVVRIISTGRSGKMTRVVQMVVRKGGVVPQLITYKEL